MKCLNCGQELTGNQRKYCCQECDYECTKEKRKQNLKKWIEDNRAHWNKMCLKNTRVYQDKVYGERKRAGLCKCGRERKDKEWAFCEKCRRRFRRPTKMNWGCE